MQEAHPLSEEKALQSKRPKREGKAKAAAQGEARKQELKQGKHAPEKKTWAKVVAHSEERVIEQSEERVTAHSEVQLSEFAADAVANYIQTFGGD